MEPGKTFDSRQLKVHAARYEIESNMLRSSSIELKRGRAGASQRDKNQRGRSSATSIKPQRPDLPRPATVMGTLGTQKYSPTQFSPQAPRKCLAALPLITLPLCLLCSAPSRALSLPEAVTHRAAMTRSEDAVRRAMFGPSDVQSRQLTNIVLSRCSLGSLMTSRARACSHGIAHDALRRQ